MYESVDFYPCPGLHYRQDPIPYGAPHFWKLANESCNKTRVDSKQDGKKQAKL